MGKDVAPLLPSAEYPQTTMATIALTSPLPLTSLPESKPTRLPVTQATSKPTASSLSSSTKTTAEFTESTTVTLLTSVPGMTASHGESGPGGSQGTQATGVTLTLSIAHTTQEEDLYSQGIMEKEDQ